MTNQLRFRKTKGRQPQRFMQSAGFLDAFLYLKYTVKTHNREPGAPRILGSIAQENPVKRAPHRSGPADAPRNRTKII